MHCGTCGSKVCQAIARLLNRACPNAVTPQQIPEHCREFGDFGSQSTYTPNDPPTTTSKSRSRPPRYIFIAIRSSPILYAAPEISNSETSKPNERLTFYRIDGSPKVRRRNPEEEAVRHPSVLAPCPLLGIPLP